MKATARVTSLLAALFCLALLTSCKPPDGDDGTWVYDFMSDGDAISDSAWYVDAGGMGEYASGYWLNQASIAAPYLFTGDFTAEFVFYLKYVDDDDIYHFAFRLVDPLWEGVWSQRNYCSLDSYYTKFSPEHIDAYYEVAQGNGDDAYVSGAGNIPGLTSGLNTCRMVRTGSTVKMYMNGTLVGTVTVNAANAPIPGYAPLIFGHNNLDEPKTNFYIRKLTVTYTPGEVVEYDWNS